MRVFHLAPRKSVYVRPRIRAPATWTWLRGGGGRAMQQLIGELFRQASTTSAGAEMMASGAACAGAG